MKKHLITVFFALLATVASAESNFGKDYYGLGEYASAKEYFTKQLATAPAESNYYLGEIAWAEGNIQVATSFFDKGIAADILYPMNYIGKGKTLLKTNRKEAESLFSTALKKHKKSADVNVAIARAYYETGLRDMVPLKLELARKYGKKSPLVYIFEGDMLVAEQKYGDAAGKYEQAVYFDPSNTVAIVKSAEVYESINPPLAVEKLKVVLDAHPDYTIVKRYLGRAYNSNGMYKNAIESFVTFYGEGTCAFEDIYRLATAYYFTEQYDKSILLLDQGLAQDSTNFVLNRFRMYNAAKTGDTLVGTPVAIRFFNLQGNTFIDKDYAAYATILADAGLYTEALEQYNKVISADAAKPETYKELATLYTKINEPAKSAESYQKYIDMLDEYVRSGSDYYTMGRSWYSAGQEMNKDSTEEAKLLAKEYLTKADTAFGTVCVKSPGSHYGYLWRGHTNAVLDPETTEQLAKPYYEQALAIINQKIVEGADTATYKRDLLYIYRYEAWCSYVAEDYENALLFSKKILELYPSNADAQSLIENVNQLLAQPEAKGTKNKKTAATASTATKK